MNEWGVPDWRDASAYAEGADWTLARWRWEFYRRRADVRSLFDKHASLEYERNKALFALNPAGQPDGVREIGEAGFHVSVVQRDANGALHRPFGYETGLPNPRIGAQPQWLIAGACSASVTHSMSTNDPVRTNERKFAFDLDRPLDPQIKLARELLRGMQSERNGTVMQPRKHQSKWPDYLRTLDARDNGASWRKIYEVALSPTGRYSDKNPEKTASDVWDAARTLQFNFPA